MGNKKLKGKVTLHVKMELNEKPEHYTSRDTALYFREAMEEAIDKFDFELEATAIDHGQVRHCSVNRRYSIDSDTSFPISGKAEHVRKEFIRCWTHATLMLLELHKMPLPHREEWKIRLLDLSRRSVPLTGEVGIGGYCNYAKREIGLEKTMSAEGMATAIVHEWIHAVQTFQAGSNEKCCSTLTARLKPIITPLAEILLKDYYRVAAYKAHTRPDMAYTVKKGDDHYDDGQWVETGVTDPYKEKEKARKRRRDS